MTDGKNIKELIKQVLQELQDDEPKGYEADMEPDPRLNLDLNQEQAFEIVDFTPGYGDFVLKELFNNNFFEGSYIAGNISWLGPIPDCDIDDLKAELKEYAKMDQEQFNPIDNLENLINDQENEDEDYEDEDFYMDEELEDSLEESGYKRKGTLVKESKNISGSNWKQIENGTFGQAIKVGQDNDFEMVAFGNNMYTWKDSENKSAYQFVLGDLIVRPEYLNLFGVSENEELDEESLNNDVDLEDEVFAMDYPLAVKLLRVLVKKYPDTEVSDYASDILITADELGDEYNDLQEDDVKDALFQLMTIVDEINKTLDEASCNLTEDSLEYKTFNKGDKVIILDIVRDQISILIDDEGIKGPDEIFATIRDMYEADEILDDNGQPIPVSIINEVLSEEGISDTIEETISIGSMGQPGTAGQGTNSGRGNSAIEAQPFRKKKIVQEEYDESTNSDSIFAIDDDGEEYEFTRNQIEDYESGEDGEQASILVDGKWYFVLDDEE